MNNVTIKTIDARENDFIQINGIDHTRVVRRRKIDDLYTELDKEENKLKYIVSAGWYINVTKEEFERITKLLCEDV